MKLCSRKIASGSAKIVCAIQTCANVPRTAQALVDLHAADLQAAREELQQRHERHLDRHDLQREDER